MCCNKNRCFITLEALTPTSGTTVLPDNNRINNGQVVSIMMRRSGGATLKTAKGTTVASDAVVGTAHIVLVNNNGQKMFDPLPLSTLQRDYNNPAPLPVDLTGLDLAQSTITFDGTGATATHCFEIIFGLACDEFCA